MSWKITKRQSKKRDCNYLENNNEWIIFITLYSTFSDVNMSFPEEYLKNPRNNHHIEILKMK